MAANSLRFRVHSVVPGTQRAVVEFEGQQIESLIYSSIVEITSDEPRREHGTLTLRFAGPDMDWARQLFVQDGQVDVTFAKVDAAPEPAPVAPEPQV